MKAPSLDELVQLPEPLALQRHFDARNYRVFRWVLALVLLGSLPGIATAVTRQWTLQLVFFLLNLVVALLLLLLRRERFYATWFRQMLLGFSFWQIVVMRVASLRMVEPEPFFVMAAVVLVLYRLRVSEHLMLFGALWVAAVLPLPFVTALGAPAGENTVAFTALTLVCLVFALLFTHLERRRFLLGWRIEHTRSRERLRMREEIEYARKIQLSMLPQLPPDIGWIELAAASLPATEVGGDYYDYFRLSASQIALVIGDVSGHGLASGLLLSGVRSCLYLLEKDLASPVGVLERLNLMVRKTTERRTYVTLLCAVLERGADGTAALTVASAGHLPVLRHTPGEKTFEEIGQGAPPLGTFLEARYIQERRELRRGELLILYTDGLIEARNEHGQEYGEARLQRAIARAAGNRSIRDIRDGILGDLANFKGDTEQWDDITLVVARLR